MKRALRKNKKQLILTALFLPIIVLTVTILVQPQRIQQFAQQIYSGPPLFGCLQVGEGRTSTCGTRLGKQLGQTFTLHDRPLNGQPVYYGDRLSGSLEYTNVGDLPINVRNLTLYAESGITQKRVTFLPGSGQVTLNPGQTLKTEEASYRFNWNDPRGAWAVGGVLTDTNGQSAEIDAKKENIVVNATCTALRIQELTEKDKSNLKALCSSNPNSKLCSSKQYCEIFKGEGCTQPNVSQETDRWQCDQYVYLPKPEQDLLEEFCKVYPDTDACKDFCARSLDSSICPAKYLFIDTYTGKPIEKFKHPRAVFVRNANGLSFKYSKDYPTDKARIHVNMEELATGSAAINNPPSVKGVKIIAALDGGSPLGGTAPRPQFGTCGASPCPPPPAAVPAVNAQNAKGCPPGEKIQTVKAANGQNANICVPAPPPIIPNCMPDMEARKECRPEVCSADKACDARNNKLLTFRCNQGGAKWTNADGSTVDTTAPNSHVPGAGCRKNPPPVRANPGAAAPPQCGEPGLQQCNLEKNELPPDPAKGRLLDPTTCNEDGSAKPPYTKCTSLTAPEIAEEGDFGYAKECRSKRRDQNPNDDPSGVPQHACCASSLSLREGCCGQDCGVWSQKAGPDGRIVYRDGAGRVCTNNADVEQNNFCSGVDKDGVDRTRENTIPGNLRGTGGLTQGTPPGFLPQQPGSDNTLCDVNNSNCNAGLTCQSINGKQGVCAAPNSAGAVAPGTKVSEPSACYERALQFNRADNTCGAAALPNNANADCGKSGDYDYDDPLSIGTKTKKDTTKLIACCRDKCASRTCHDAAYGILYCGTSNNWFFKNYGTPGAQYNVDNAPVGTVVKCGEGLKPVRSDSRIGGAEACAPIKHPEDITCKPFEVPVVSDAGPDGFLDGGISGGPYRCQAICPKNETPVKGQCQPIPAQPAPPQQTGGSNYNVDNFPPYDKNMECPDGYKAIFSPRTGTSRCAFITYPQGATCKPNEAPILGNTCLEVCAENETAVNGKCKPK